MIMDQDILKIDQLTFGFPDRRVLFADMNMTLQPGERVGLVGANGAGKTTLFNILMGFRHPQAGKISWFNRHSSTEKDFLPVRKRVGFLFQNADDQLFCATVGEDIAFGPFNLGHTRDEVTAIVTSTLDALGLSSYENRITYHLSEGEKRLVSLAAVLAMKPEVLLLDEPTNGLDDKARDRILHHLQSLPQAMLIASHDRPFLDALTSRTISL